MSMPWSVSTKSRIPPEGGGGEGRRKKGTEEGRKVRTPRDGGKQTSRRTANVLLDVRDRGTASHLLLVFLEVVLELHLGHQVGNGCGVCEVSPRVTDGSRIVMKHDAAE